MSAIELRVLLRFYRSKLNHYSSIEHQQVSELALLKIAAEASSLNKILLDFADEGYTDFVDEIVRETNALEWLQQFVSQTLARLGPSAEKERFYLYPEVVEVAGLADLQFDKGPTFALEIYLNQLDQQADQVSEIAHCFDNSEQMQHWQAKTHILMTEMVAFLLWIVERLRQQPDFVPVLLLRDTLLPYFGLRWLHQRGVTIPSPRPLFLSRKFAASFEEGEDIYTTLSSTILYGVLYEAGFCDMATLRQLFVSRASSVFTKEDPFTKTSRAYLDALSLEGPPFVIESGLHGTFPLWLLTLTNNVGDFGLYTTAPWLYDTYQGAIFRRNYNYLRDTETIVAHDCLFQYKSRHNGNIIVSETPNSIAKSLAHYELHLFKQLVNQKIDANL